LRYPNGCALSIAIWPASNSIFPTRRSVFQPQLRIIGCVLILASTASAEHRTRRRYAIGRRLFNAQEARPLDVLSRLGSFGFDSLARQYERREDDFAIQQAESFTAVNQLFNVELQT
jgi:hypothetical protein